MHRARDARRVADTKKANPGSPFSKLVASAHGHDASKSGCLAGLPPGAAHPTSAPPDRQPRSDPHFRPERCAPDRSVRDGGAQVVNRDVKSYNAATVDVRRRAADRARDDANKLTDDRKQQEAASVQAAKDARAAEAALKDLQARQVSARTHRLWDR